MLNRKKLDRIIVPSNEKFQQIIDWCEANEKSQQFYSPMETGVVELQEEKVEFTFELKEDGIVEFAIYVLDVPSAPPIVVYGWDFETMQPTYVDFTKVKNEMAQMELRFIVAKDNTLWKEAIKYHALMYYMTYHVETIEVTERGKRSKHEARALRKDKSRPLPLVKKHYVINYVETETNGKRAYTKPDHEVSVRGYFKTLRSGKTIWVRGYKKYKGKEEHNSIYSL
jgi:hypothetical protein